MPDDRSTLAPMEPHPAKDSAVDYLASLGYERILILLESFSSCAIEGNRLAEVCAGTLRRLLDKEPVSDRYLLGLAWTIRDMEDTDADRDTSSPVTQG